MKCHAMASNDDDVDDDVDDDDDKAVGLRRIVKGVHP